MSHLHFVETEVYRRRVVQMGEDPWRVNLVGAMGLDNLHEIKLLSSAELEALHGIKLDQPPLLVTFHSVTRELGKVEHYMTELLAALDHFDEPIIFTYPNADTDGR